MADEQRIKIVLVEDEPAIQIYTKTILNSIPNVEVFATDNGEDAIKLVSEHQPALIVQDLWLKGTLNGWDCIRHYRSFNDKVKILIISADMRTDGSNDMKLLVQLAVSATIEKPYSPEKLKNLVKKILEQDYPYKDSGIKTSADIYVKVTPEVEGILHKIRGLLGVVRNRCEDYWLDYSVDPHLIGSNSQEITKKALKSLKECSAEIDCIEEELDKIKFFN